MARRTKGEGSVLATKRADGRWAAVANVRTGNGRLRKWVYGKTKAEAAAKLRKVLHDLDRGIRPADERTTIEAFLGMWLRDVVKPNKRPGTYSGYEVNCRLHIIPCIGKVPLAKLTPTHVRALLKSMSDQGLSTRTCQYAHATLRTALKSAVADELVSRNVAALVSGPSLKQEEVDPYSPEEVHQLLEGVQGDRLEALYVCAFTLGLRQSELLGLRWQDVNLDAASLRVVQVLDKARADGATFAEPKSEKSKRTLPLPAPTVAALTAHRDRQAEEKCTAKDMWRESGLVFTTRVGTAVDQRNAGRYFTEHQKRLGMRHTRFHDMRHACATYLLSQGVPLRVVQEVLGHSQIGITGKIYAHVVPQLMTEAMAHMDRAFGNLGIGSQIGSQTGEE